MIVTANDLLHVQKRRLFRTFKISCSKSSQWRTGTELQVNTQSVVVLQTKVILDGLVLAQCKNSLKKLHLHFKQDRFQTQLTQIVESTSFYVLVEFFIIKRLFHYLNITHFFQLLVQTKSYVSQTDQFYANLVCLNLSMKQHSFFILILSPIKH